MGVKGEIDWIDLADFQKCIDGMFVHDIKCEFALYPSRVASNAHVSRPLCAVNYMGEVRCCKAFLPIFKEQAIKKSYTNARIFNMVSMAGMVSGGAVS